MPSAFTVINGTPYKYYKTMLLLFASGPAGRYKKSYTLYHTNIEVRNIKLIVPILVKDKGKCMQLTWPQSHCRVLRLKKFRSKILRGEDQVSEDLYYI